MKKTIASLQASPTAILLHPIFSHFMRQSFTFPSSLDAMQATPQQATVMLSGNEIFVYLEYIFISYIRSNNFCHKAFSNSYGQISSYGKKGKKKKRGRIVEQPQTGLLGELSVDIYILKKLSKYFIGQFVLQEYGKNTP